MTYSTRFRLIASFLGVSLLVGALSLFVGVELLQRNVVNEAANRVRLDLNAAREIYHSTQSYILLKERVPGPVEGAPRYGCNRIHRNSGEPRCADKCKRMLSGFRSTRGRLLAWC